MRNHIAVFFRFVLCLQTILTGGFLVCALLPAHSFAGEVDIPHQAPASSLGEYASYLILPSGTGNPANLLEAEQLQGFSRSRHPLLHFGYIESEIWIELSLHNSSATERSFVISIDKTDLEHAAFYTRTTAVSGQSPQHQPPQTIQLSRLPYATPATVVSLPAYSTTQLLIRVQSRSLLTFGIFMQPTADFHESQGQALAQNSMLVGIALSSAIVMLVLFYRSRTPVYLHLGLVSLSLVFFLALNKGLLPAIKWLPLERQIPLEMSALMLLLGLELQFSRSFLAIQQTRHTLDSILRAAITICFFGAIFALLRNTAESNEACALLGLFMIPLQFIITLQCASTSPFPLRWLIVSRALITLGCAIFVLGTITRLQITTAFINEYGWLLAIEVLLLHVALFQRQQELERQAQASHLKNAIAQAEIRARNEFLTQLSHEIRTPMNGILGMTELLEETPLSPIQNDYVKTITASGSSLLGILDDILDYSRIETGKMALDISIFELATVLNDCLEVFQPRAQEKSIQLNRLTSNDTPVHVKGDPIRIRQVLAHLISNAIRFTEQGEVLLTVSYDLDKTSPHIRFEVRDTGVGIPKQRLRQLLDGQQSGDKSGLGLTIASQLVRMMGGRLNATSEPGKGSTFWFSIPLETAAVESTGRPFYVEQLQGLRMLVVDDNASCRLVIQQQAAGWGVQVTTAVNGKQAMALLRSQTNLEEPFDVVILDHDMPGMSGLDLAARIKEDPLIYNNLLVLMLASPNSAPAATLVRNAGVRRIIAKPITGRMLKAILIEELGQLRRINTMPPPDTAQRGQALNLRILIAEDHPLSQKVINGMMQRLGVKSKLVINGVQAVEEARRGKYDLILMDCDMPEMDGFEAARRIREWEAQSQRTAIPIIALTAHIMDEHKERSLASGMNAHLSKPIELNELRNALLYWAKPSIQPLTSETL
ncbi:sensor histidine kinase/response regulator [gamma proteobacterium HdN1]|nr:sensor histidine kinase/response regulator [gamma proteobacterium HdN1]